jgi:hypothetical protein
MPRKITIIIVLLLTSVMLISCAGQQQPAFKSVEGKRQLMSG